MCIRDSLYDEWREDLITGRSVPPGSLDGHDGWVAGLPTYDEFRARGVLELPTPATTPSPVSYTHLDVYKRQRHDRPRRNGCERDHRQNVILAPLRVLDETFRAARRS